LPGKTPRIRRFRNFERREASNQVNRAVPNYGVTRADRSNLDQLA
jgi:hypothetical protein